MSDETKMTHFCPMCFADDDGGSWGAGVIGGEHCINCGAHPAVEIPQWAVNSIRQQASWVGSRYYPGDEDREIRDERKALLDLVETFPGREVMPARKWNGEEWEVDDERWEIRQNLPAGNYMMTTVEATSAEDAREKSRYLLRYIPAVKS